MKINIKYFGMIGEITGKENEVLELSNGANATKVLEQLRAKYSKLSVIPCNLAVNKAISTGNQPLKDNDEIALLPPFAGG